MTTSTSKHAGRLTAATLPEPTSGEPHLEDLSTAGVRDVVAHAADRDARFADGVRTLRVGGATIKLEERILLVLGGIIAPLGLVVVFLGWWGASHSPYVFEQLPYLISGGLFGLGLVFLGSFLYFAHWMTQLVKEHRVQSVAIVEALQRLQDEVERQRGDNVYAGAVTGPTATVAVNGATSATALVATVRGTMAHRPECVVVSGKPDLRVVGADDGLAPCKMCDPYGEAITPD